MTLNNDGVGIPSENPNLTAEWTTEINAYADKIKSGEITVVEIPKNLE